MHLNLIFIVCCALAVFSASAKVNAANDVDNPASGDTSIKLASTTLIPGVVIDPRRKRIYLMRSAGGIESLDVDTGRVLWTSNHADQPLFVTNGVLFARPTMTTSGLVVKSLNQDTGELSPAATPTLVPLPSDVIAGIDDTLERSFKNSIAEVDGKIILSYEFIQRDISGIAPTGSSGFLRHKIGAFRYLGGEFEAVSSIPISSSKKNWPKELKTLFESKRVLRPPWKTKNLLAITEQTYNPNLLTLKRWLLSNGVPLADKTLFKGRALAILASCDEKYIVVAVPSGQAALEPQYLQLYYELDFGKLVAKLNSWRSIEPFCVQGSRLLTISQPNTRYKDGELIKYPLELVVRDLTSGVEIWRRAFRDTAFRGTAPPRN